MRALVLLLLVGCGSSIPMPLGLAAPAAPTDLEVRIVNRRAVDMEVCWRAPAVDDLHPPATSYEVRYAKVPISGGNFDDPMVTQRVPFSGVRRPYAARERVCQLVTGLYIENGYYFAVSSVVGDPPPALGVTKEPTS